MEKRVFTFFAILLLLGIVLGIPLTLAQDNGSEEKERAARENIINAIVGEEIEEEDTEVKIEIESEGEKRKIKIKAKGAEAERIRERFQEALKESNRLRIHSQNNASSPEGCNRTGAVLKCQAQEKLRTKIDIESNVDLSEELRETITELRESFNALEYEAEFELEAETDDGEIDIESETKGDLTEEQLTLTQEIVEEVSSLVSENEEAEIKIKITRKMETERTMTIHAGKSGNIIIQSKNINASTNVTLYHHNRSVYGIFKDNETRLIEVLPGEVMEKIKAHLEARINENETEIELDEEGEYRAEVRKEARFLGLFKIKERLRLRLNSETGEVLQENAPWWGFLANDIEAESETETEAND